jgi:hypothetical protein
MELRKISDKYQQIISLTNYLLVLTVAFSAAFPNRIFNILWVAWLATWLLEGRFLKKSNFSFDKSKVIILMLAGFSIWEAVSILWAEDKKAGFSVLERQMSFLAIVPVALSVSTVLQNFYNISKSCRGCIGFCAFVFDDTFIC